MTTFENDLMESEQIVDKFASLPRWIKPFVSEGYNADFDVKIWDTLFEIKMDRRAHETGNVAIELACRGKLSWIVWTKSHYIVYYVMWEFWICDANELRQNLKWRVVFWGDGSASLLLLVKLEHFKSLFKLLDDKMIKQIWQSQARIGGWLITKSIERIASQYKIKY